MQTVIWVFTGFKYPIYETQGINELNLENPTLSYQRWKTQENTSPL